MLTTNPLFKIPFECYSIYYPSFSEMLLVEASPIKVSINISIVFSLSPSSKNCSMNFSLPISINLD